MRQKKRFFILFLLLVAISGMAQKSSVFKTVANSPKAVVSASKGANAARRTPSSANSAGKTYRSRGTAFRGAVRILPGVNYIEVTSGNHNRDTITRIVNRHRFVEPLPPIGRLKPVEFKSPLQIMEERTAERYQMAKEHLAQGKFDEYPMYLFYWANYAKHRGDDTVAVDFLGHIDPATLTPALLYRFSNDFSDIQEYGPALVNSLNMTAYAQMVEAKYAGADCDSARMQDGDTLMIVTDKYLPYLTPLTELSCFYDPSKEIDRYKVATDSLLANYSLLTPQFKDTFFSNLLSSLFTAGEYKAALEYFEREPLKSYPDSLADFALDLASCSWATNDSERFNRYVKQAWDIDSVATQNYWDEVYTAQLNYFIADPTQTDAADWLLDNTEYHAESALNIVVSLMSYYFPDNLEDNWQWPVSTTYTPEQLVARNGMIYVLDRVGSLDISNAETLTPLYLDYLKASIICTLDNRAPEAVNILDSRLLKLAETPVADSGDVQCWLTITRAFIAGHGLDKPKDALKILKKNICLLDSEEVETETRALWYDYMALLSRSAGKSKDYEKYLRLKGSSAGDDPSN